MREKDRKEKLEWESWMAERHSEFTDEVSAAKASGEPWQSGRVDGELQTEWEHRHRAVEVANGHECE